LSVVDVSPSDGATQVSGADVEGVCFSQAINPADATTDRFWVADEAGNVVSGLQVTLSGTDGACVALKHDVLPGNSAFLIHLQPGIRAASGTATLPIEVESRFRTAPSPQ
jgi:hypothetical protein